MIVDKNILRQAGFQKRLVTIAEEAGKAILNVRLKAELGINLKADLSPVTAADLAANAVIEAALPALLRVPIVSEETFDPSLAPCTAFWLIDPLDGTREFITGSGDFTVNIALIEHGTPIFGAVYAPARELAYWGGPGIGAWRETGTAEGGIHVAPRQTPLRVVASANNLNDATRDFIAGLGEHVLVQAGSSIKICMIAEGSADVYPRLSPTSEWDTAAADAVLRGAGGGLFKLDGSPLDYGKTNVLNPSFVARAGHEMTGGENLS